jgi:hypothetical protein
MNNFSDAVGGAAAWSDVIDLANHRMTQYVERWESAMAKMAASDYHSEDFVDDWFSLLGGMMRDATAAGALSWRMLTGTARRAEGAGAADEQ